jgi:hypothetical protein
MEKRGRNKPKVGMEVKWWRNNKESRCWIRVRKGVWSSREEGGVEVDPVGAVLYSDNEERNHCYSVGEEERDEGP